MSTAVAESAPAQTETATTEAAPNLDAESASFFEGIKSQHAQPETEPEPKTAKEKYPDKEAAIERDKKLSGEPAKSDRVAIPEKLVGDKPDEPAAASTEEDDGLEPPAGISKKGEASWKLMRETVKTLRAEVALERQQKEQLKTAPPQVDEKTTEELKAWKQKATEYSETLKLVAVERSEDFQKLTARENKVIERAKTAAKAYEVEPALIDAAAKLPLAERIKFLSSQIEDAEARGEVSRQLHDIDRLADEKSEMLENSKSKAAQYEATQKATEQKVRDHKVGENAAAFRDTFETLQKELKGFRKSADGKATQWDADVDGRINRLKDAGKSLLSEHMTPQQSSALCQVIAEALELEVIENDLEYSKEELKKARAELARLKPAQPTAGDTSAQFVASNDASQDWNSADAAANRFERAKATVGAQ